ncbi:MAG: asparagine synthase C-terminal domain-containing protein, partial [Thermoanaerobaculia bacterium]|nr:asparagine synthase C-terminal domain-containing protein [Thermoanaerobaculia bacterium]
TTSPPHPPERSEGSRHPNLHSCHPERSEGSRRTNRDDSWDQVQRLEATLYMRNQLLRDSDWAAMASSVELRVPLVDPILWAQMARLGHEPARTQGKAALVRAVARDLPAELWNRPKSGFAVPVAEWICPPRAGDRDSAGLGSRRLALRVLEELGICPAR